jgi:hypothetical protein
MKVTGLQITSDGTTVQHIDIYPDDPETKIMLK